MTENPNYIPLKFKPKHIQGESEAATRVRIDQTRTSYQNNIELLTTYAANHESKYTQIDTEVKNYIDSLTEEPDIRDMLKDWWSRDTVQCEEYSSQLWIKRETFLNTKKREDISNNNVEMTELSWTDIVQGRNKRKNNPRQNVSNLPLQPSIQQNNATGVSNNKRKSFNNNNRRNYRNYENQTRQHWTPNRGSIVRGQTHITIITWIIITQAVIVITKTETMRESHPMKHALFSPHVTPDFLQKNLFTL